VLRDVAITAGDGVATVCFRAVPREEVLVVVEMFSEGAPVVPVLLQGVDDVGFVVATLTDFPVLE
jgi:hypothetical protein